LHAYKAFPKLEKAPTKTQPAIFSRASRAKAKKVSQMANIFFLRGVRGETWKTSLIVFVGSKKSCVFPKASMYGNPISRLEFSRKASSQVSMAAEMDSAPQGICHDENHHFLEN